MRYQRKLIKTYQAGTCLLSVLKTFDPAFEFLSVASLVNPIGKMPPSSLRTTVKWLNIPGLFHSEGNMGVSIWKVKQQVVDYFGIVQ